MKRDAGVVNLWIALVVLPVIVIAMMALLDYVKWQQMSSRLALASSFALDWCAFEQQGDLFSNFGIRTIISEGFEEKIVPQLKAQWSHDEREVMAQVSVVSFSVGQGLTRPEVIKTTILQQHRFAFSVKSLKRLTEMFGIVEKIQQGIKALSSTLRVIELTEVSTLRYTQLIDEFHGFKDVLAPSQSNPVTLLRNDLDAIMNQGLETLRALEALRLLLDQPTIDHTTRQRLEIDRVRLETEFRRTLTTLENLQKTLITLKSSVHHLFQFCIKAQQLSETLDEMMAEIKALDLENTEDTIQNPLFQGEAATSTGKLKMPDIKPLWNHAGKLISVTKEALDKFIPDIQRWQAALDLDIDGLLSAILRAQSEFDQGLTTNANTFLQLAIEEINSSPNLISLNPLDAVDLVGAKAYEMISPRSFREWLTKQELKQVENLSRIYAGLIPEAIFRELPSQIGNDGSSETQRDSMLEGGDGFKKLLQPIEIFIKLQEVIKGLGKGLVDRAVIIDYVLTYFSYNVPDNFGKDRELGEIEYILIGSQHDLANAVGTDVQIGLIRTALNAVALLITKQEMLQGLSTQVAAATGGISYPVVYGLVLSGWSIAESLVDLQELHRAERVALLKLNGEFSIDLDFALKGKSANHSKSILDEASKMFSIDWSYSEYLALLLCLVPERELLLRIADRWQLNSNYSLTKHCTLVDLEVGCPYSGIIFRGGQIQVPIQYHISNGTVIN